MISQALILTAFIIVILTTLSFTVARAMLERTVLSQLSVVATIAEDALQETLRSHRERASLLTSHGDIRDVIANRSDDDALGRLLTVLRRDQSMLTGMEVYGTDGRLLAGAGEEIGLPDEALRLPYHRPVIGSGGWEFYDVFTPVWEEGGVKTGYLALRYDAAAALAPLLAVTPSLGDSAEMILVLNRNGEIQLLHPSADNADSYVLSLGRVDDMSVQSPAITRSLDAEEGVMRAEDYRGRDTLVAYRFLPSLGWGMAMQIDRDAALQDVRRMAIAHAAIGTLLLILAATLASLLARQVTQPLRTLTDRVRQLRPGNWNISRTVDTGDEVEVLEEVVVDMAGRLQHVYEKQEEVIEERTGALKRQYAFDRAILESIEYGVVTVGPDGKVTGANPAAATMLQLAPDSMTGKPITDVVAICGHRGNPLESQHPALECLKAGETMRSPVNAHFNIRLHDETLMPVMYAVSPLIAGGSVFGAILVFQDISEERRLDYLKSEFITLASHQLRTPLSALRWYVELFTDDQEHLSDEQKSYLEEMQHSVKRMVALLTSLLHAAHLEGSNLEPDVHPVDVREVMNELQEDCQTLVHESGLACSLIAAGEPMIVETDPTLLRIVLQNLLSNAVKYSPRDSNKQVTMGVQQSADGVTITVADEGWGIPKAEQHRVFQKFFRARNIRKMDTDGNGLGLYITKSIVERLGGSISFVSEEDKGTTFTLKIPLFLHKHTGMEGAA